MSSRVIFLVVSYILSEMNITKARFLALVPGSPTSVKNSEIQGPWWMAANLQISLSRQSFVVGLCLFFGLNLSDEELLVVILRTLCHWELNATCHLSKVTIKTPLKASEGLRFRIHLFVNVHKTRHSRMFSLSGGMCSSSLVSHDSLLNYRFHTVKSEFVFLTVLLFSFSPMKYQFVFHCLHFAQYYH